MRVFHNSSTSSISNNWFSNSLISSLYSWLLLYLYLNSLLINSWLNYSLFIIFISWYIYSLSSCSILIYSVSSDWISVNYLIRGILEINLNLFSFSNWLDKSISNVLISWESVISSTWIILSLNWSINNRKGSSDILRWLNSDLLSDSSYSRFNKIVIYYLITRYLYIFNSIFLSELSWSCYWVSIDYSIWLSLELRCQFLSYSSNRWLNNDFLSSWLNHLLSNYSWFSYYSLSDNFWFSRNSLSNDSWLYSDSFGFYFCISQKWLNILSITYTGLYFRNSISKEKHYCYYFIYHLLNKLFISLFFFWIYVFFFNLY